MQPFIVFCMGMLQLLPLLLIEHYTQPQRAWNYQQIALTSVACIITAYVLQATYWWSSVCSFRAPIHIFLQFPKTGYGCFLGLLLNVFLFDLIGYLTHRAMHRYRWLWHFHVTHHALVEVKSISAVQHVVDMTLMQVVPVMMLAPIIIVASQAPGFFAWYLLIHNWLVHAELDFLNYGWLNYVIGGPAFHRAHHCSAPMYHNKNFALFFPWIDMLFGTYEKPNPHYFYGPFGVSGKDNPSRLSDVLF